MNKHLNVASLFCGCGGSDLGMIGGFTYLGKEYPRLNYDIVYAIDIDSKAIQTYNANFEHKAVCADVTEVDFNEIQEEIDVMIGGFPCQSFSTVNPTKDTNDERANLYKQIVRFLHTKQPKYFICENVKGLLTLQGGSIIQKIAREFRDEGYNIQYRLLKAVEFGIPQKRERVIIVGIRSDMNVRYSYPSSVNTERNVVPLSKVIDKLAIEEQRYYFSEKAVQGMKNAKKNMKRGLWQDLNGPCLTITSHLAKTSINSRDPVLLVDAEKELYRRFTPREAARIQSFPDKFVFPTTETSAYRQIGNAIPPVFMWHIAKALQDSIANKKMPPKNTHLYSIEEEHFAGNWTQLSLFEPDALYLYNIDKSVLIGSCRQGTKNWITANMMYNYPITQNEIDAHPELLNIKKIVIMHRKTVVGYYVVESIQIVDKSWLKKNNYPIKSSKHNSDTKYLLFNLEGTNENPSYITRHNSTLIIGKGTKIKDGIL
ncbi:MAG: DNA cytosine methyltransferase [Prevotella sp.]|nr:DNA cytosine methyltransferase [Prevotella sp.]